MRTDEAYLTDILEAADEIAEFIADLDRSSFLRDRVIQRAVVYDLIVVGEAANKVAPDLRRRFPHVQWRSATDLRNLAVHGYFAVTYSRVWETITVDLPVLREQIAAILDAEFRKTTSHEEL